MILYVYIVSGTEVSDDGSFATTTNLAVTGSAKKALDRAAEYVATSIRTEDAEPVPVLDKAKMSELKKKLKTETVTVESPKTTTTATVKKFNLE